MSYFIEGLLGVSEEDRVEDYEISYFTGFIKEITSPESLGEVVIDCIKPVGCIKDIDNSDPLCVDIWITTKEGETHCMHLFDYQYGVVEFGG